MDKTDKPSLNDILTSVDDQQVSRVEKSTMRARRRLAKPTKTAKRQQKATKEFIDNYDHKLPYRPEPARLVHALSLPPEQQQAALEDAMSARQRAFCREYTLDFHARDAAIRAGYSAAGASATARNLLQFRGITRLIDIYTESKASKITAIDPEWVISKITEIVTQDEAKHGDKLRGLELLARHLGMFIERTEISGRDGEAIKIEETKQQASEVARKIREMGKRAGLSVVK